MESTVKAADASAIPFDSLSQKVFLDLWKTYDILRGIENECLADFGISAQQYNVLRILESNLPAPVPTMELSRQMISKAPDITRMLDRLESRKWVRRTRPRANRRIVEASITPQGLKLVNEMHDAILQMHQRQVGHLKKREKEQLIDLLKMVRKPHRSASEGWLS
ncbi:MarR family winged helix-turn-helix transcriptional regulator [Stieleria varia]|uniref:Multiple antibiotic resistance protein MarR n=1 Tax=Stieleria varia TaxID=2528005 RepID=A0A5C6B4S9_9BACT|nr:MarR family transcriptional regulator [Stieleria varia]TWU06286.1 Multiple antibiotic resistance protein MarR [Stieleria varia]